MLTKDGLSEQSIRFLRGPRFPGRQCRPSRVARESTYPEIAIFIPKEAYMRSMSTLPDPNIGNLTPQGRKSRILRRLPGACMRCRQRKIRCDASISGPLCTNCRLDGRSSCVRPHFNQPSTTSASATIVHSSSETLGRITNGDYTLADRWCCR
jgi:hypothetical protein